MTVERACLLSHVQYTISELNALEAIFFQVKENSLFQNFFLELQIKIVLGAR